MANILVIDDENDVLKITSTMLTSSGHEVLKATDGEKALDMVKNNNIDLILLDAVMPGMHGLDVCRSLKRNPMTKVIPVIIYGALGSGIDMMLDKRDKADAYIGKPFTKEILIEKVNQQLE